MMGGGRYSNGDVAESGRAMTGKMRNFSERPSEMSTLVNSNIRNKRDEIYRSGIEEKEKDND